MTGFDLFLITLALAIACGVAALVLAGEPR
jgi:hypothetical protein